MYSVDYRDMVMTSVFEALVDVLVWRHRCMVVLTIVMLVMTSVLRRLMMCWCGDADVCCV